MKVERMINMTFAFIATIINFIILIAIAIGVFKAIQYCKNYIIRNKEMDKKIDVILSKLEIKDDN